MIVHLASFWKREFLELGNGPFLLQASVQRLFPTHIPVIPTPYFASSSYFLSQPVWDEGLYANNLTTYHLRGKTRHSGWKIKWFAPFRLRSFTEKYGLWFAANPAIFSLFLVCLDDLDIFCSGSFSHHVKFQSFIQLFGERLSDKVNATTLKGIVGGLSALFFKEIWKNGSRGHGHMSMSAKGKQ